MVWRMRGSARAVVVGLMLGVVLLLSVDSIVAQSGPQQVCTADGIGTGGPGFEPSGIILTTFDRDAVWVFNIAGGNRYPLPETSPCARNCRLSPDARWVTMLSPENNFAVIKMRLDGTQRTPLAAGATDVEWWDPTTLLVWTLDFDAYLVAENIPDAPREFLNVDSIISVQPGGRWGLLLRQSNDGAGFVRELVNLELRGLVGVAGAAPIPLGADAAYFNAQAWSPTGDWLAYVAPTESGGGELFGVRPADGVPVQWTDLSAAYGPSRINGHSIGDLSWSPDGTRVAFWVMPLSGPNPIENAGDATIHLYDTRDGSLTAFCGYTTTEHTPNPPRLVWSPDGTHIAFGGNVPGDDKGYLLLALNTADGSLTELSSGIFPALGAPDVIVWGLPPQ